MADDVTSIRYGCPFCDEQFAREQDVKSHITESTDDSHSGWDGYKLDRPIPVVEDSSLMPLDKKIRKAAQKFDTLSNDQANQVAEAAEVSPYRVFREWEDAGFEVNAHGRTVYRWEDLTERQRDILRAADSMGGATYSQIGDEAGVGKSSVQDVLDKYEFILEDRYRPDSLEEHNEGDETEDSSDTSNKSPSIPVDKAKLTRRLQDAGVNFTVEVNVEDDNFEVVSKLIEAGYKDLAEEYYEE